MKREYIVRNSEQLTRGVLAFCRSFEVFSVLQSNSEVLCPFPYPKYHDYDLVAGAGMVSFIEPETLCFDVLKNYCSEKKRWLFGHMSYDLKNEAEPMLTSLLPGFVFFPLMYFFEPQVVVTVAGSRMTIDASSEAECEKVYGEILQNVYREGFVPEICFSSRMLRDEYGKRFRQIARHIQQGDIYEITFCREFFAEAEVNPIDLFCAMCRTIPAPFAALYRIGNRYLISASPERFLMKKGRRLISQPMKGTAARKADPDDDKKQREILSADVKERAENVMITDLVRNDLSKTAAAGSVKVEDLFGIYTFPKVHQMVTIVMSELKEGVHFTEAIKAAFPMGSMTGAPKIRAMQLIEKYETVRRGLFSGSVGYITPEGDFDFSVIIRSLLYDDASHYLSLSAGGAITSMSDEEKEFEETELKAAGILSLFGKQNG
jgi:para-aminobenzoate synthetase component 1